MSCPDLMVSNDSHTYTELAIGSRSCFPCFRSANRRIQSTASPSNVSRHNMTPAFLGSQQFKKGANPRLDMVLARHQLWGADAIVAECSVTGSLSIIKCAIRASE